MGRVMAIVSQARLTIAIREAAFFNSSVTIAKAVLYACWCTAEKDEGLLFPATAEKAVYYRSENHAYVFVKTPHLCE